MTKKKSKKTPSQLQENTIGEEQNPSSAPKNSGSEMDEIFARIKKKFAVEKAEKLDEVTEKTDREKKNDTIGEEKTPSSAPKKLGSEIDEIFAGKKRKKPEVEKVKPDEVTKKTDRKKTNNRKKIKGRDDGEFVDRPSRPRKRTEDGLTLYTEEELGFNKGDAGGTPLCPFDCSCCF